MAVEWRTATVKQLVDEGVLERPMDGNHGEIHPKTSDFVDRGIPFIMASDLANGRVDTKNCTFIDEQQARSLRKGFALRGDVLISHKATMGRTAIVGELDVPFLILTPQVTYYRVKDSKRLSNRYLKLYFDSHDFQSLFETWGQKGSTRAYLGITAQLELPILLPPMEEQGAIAHILGTLDDKIQLNQQMNETLEAMVRVLFKSWFVDFAPVRTKAEGRDPELPQHLAELFPDSFEQSALGEIPKGWQHTPVYDIATYVNGAAYATFQPKSDRKGLPIIKIAELKAGVTSQTRFSNVDMPEKFRIGTGDILFSWSGNPDTSIDTFVWPHGPAWLNQHIFRVLPRGPNEGPFILSTLKFLKPIFAEIARNKQTTGLGHVTVDDLKRLLVARPDDRLIQAWNQIAGPLFDRGFRNLLENRDLEALRDTLLPKLISGELRIENAERFIGGGN
ncbi:MAG TPA: restriction endonuclease subunit S [Terriglobia bacterium]|jgi:type I restriction enzyme S subunit